MKIAIEVPYRDIDAMGHLNNAVYLAYFETARQKYWGRITGSRLYIDIEFVVASAAIDYRKPAYMGDVLEVEIHCARIGRSSFDFSYRMTRGHELVAEGKSTQVLWDWGKQTKKEFSAELRKKIRALEEEA
jgi:acyl-CoA thioester hydrolase